MKGEVLDTVIVVVEGDGVAQRVQPVKFINSTRMFNSEKKKEGLWVAVAVDGGGEECGGRRLDDVGQSCPER